METLERSDEVLVYGVCTGTGTPVCGSDRTRDDEVVAIFALEVDYYSYRYQVRVLYPDFFRERREREKSDAWVMVHSI